MDLSCKFGHSFICADITYQHIGLLALELSRVQELTSLCAQRSDQAKQAAEVERLRRLASGVELPLRRARQAGHARKRRSPTMSNSAAEIAAHSEVESEASARCIDGFGNGSSPSSCSEADDGDAPMPPSPDVEGPASPTANAAGRVFGPDGSYWGKISVIRPGQATEALSVYCSLHGCSVCKRMDKGVPTQAAILRWFEEGRNVPAGRVPSLQRKHKELFPAPGVGA